MLIYCYICVFLDFFLSLSLSPTLSLYILCNSKPLPCNNEYAYARTVLRCRSAVRRRRVLQTSERKKRRDVVIEIEEDKKRSRTRGKHRLFRALATRCYVTLASLEHATGGNHYITIIFAPNLTYGRQQRGTPREYTRRKSFNTYAFVTAAVLCTEIIISTHTHLTQYTHSVSAGNRKRVSTPLQPSCIPFVVRRFPFYSSRPCIQWFIYLFSATCRFDILQRWNKNAELYTHYVFYDNAEASGVKKKKKIDVPMPNNAPEKIGLRPEMTHRARTPAAGRQQVSACPSDARTMARARSVVAPDSADSAGDRLCPLHYCCTRPTRDTIENQLCTREIIRAVQGHASDYTMIIGKTRPTRRLAVVYVILYRTTMIYRSVL